MTFLAQALRMETVFAGHLFTQKRCSCARMDHVEVERKTLDHASQAAPVKVRNEDDMPAS